MKKKTNPAAKRAELKEFRTHRHRRPIMAELYRRAEAKLKAQRMSPLSAAREPLAEADPRRLLHELQVHHVELELQNAELQEARNTMEVLLEKYTDLYDFAPVSYFSLDQDGRIQHANLTGAHLVGIDRSRLLSQSFVSLISFTCRPAFQAFLTQVFAGSIKRSGDFQLLCKGQPPRIVNIEAQRRLNGQECRVVVVDITDRKRVEDEVRVSEVRYRRLFETAHDGVLLLDPATRKITDANPFMTMLLGYSHDQLVGKELFEIGLLKDEVASQEMFQKLRRTREVRYEDLPLESKKGRHQEVEVVANLYQENGHAVIQCNIRDITERKQAMDALHQSEERYRTLFNSMDEGYCIIEVIFDKRQKPIDWRYLEVNPSFEKHSGLHDATGKLISAMVPDLERSWFEIYGKVALTGQPVRIQHQAKELGDRWFDLYAFRVGGPDSRRIAVLFNNVTERKKTEQELSEKARLLDMSHDAIIVRDMAGHIRYWNQGAVTLYGWPREEALGKQSHVLLKTKFPIPLKKMTAELHRTNHWIGELLHTTRDGRRVTVFARKTLDRDGHGKAVAVLENITDITERKLAEAAQRRSEVLAASNQKLEHEIIRRREVEVSLRRSEEHQKQLLKESLQMQEKLKHLSRQVLQAQEEERKRISRELHDVIAQTLTGINIRLAALKKSAGLDNSAFERNIERTQELVRQSVDKVHEFARDLRPTVLDDLGLIPALHSFMTGFTARTGVRAHLTAFAGVDQLDLAKRTALFRVAQEALTNVERHARASRVDVCIHKLPHHLSMAVKDDGKSFDVDRTAHGKGSQRLGLLGMRERLEMVGGQFSIDSQPGHGTTVTAQIPFSSRKTGGGGKRVR